MWEEQCNFLPIHMVLIVPYKEKGMMKTLSGAAQVPRMEPTAQPQSSLSSLLMWLSCNVDEYWCLDQQQSLLDRVKWEKVMWTNFAVDVDIFKTTDWKSYPMSNLGKHTFVFKLKKNREFSQITWTCPVQVLPRLRNWPLPADVR